MFKHGMLQESLVRRATENGQIADCHRAAARMLSARSTEGRPELLERLGTHLHGARDYERAFETLLEAAEMFGEQCDFERSRRVLELCSETLDAIGADPVDVRRAQARHIQVRSLLRQGLVDEAEPIIETWVEHARENDWAQMRAIFELHLASLARKRGDSDAATELYERALELFEDLQDPVGTSKCLYGLGEVFLYRGDIDNAIAYLERAMAHLAKHDLDALVGIVLIGLASALLRVDRFNQARARLGAAVRSFKKVGNRSGRAAALNMQGELERACGNVEAAQEAYEQSIELLDSIGSRGTTIPRLNLGLVYLARSNWEQAREMFEFGLRELRATGERSHLGFVHLGLGCAAAGMEDWDAYDHHIYEASRILAETEWVDRDIAEHAGLAASLARAAGERERARAAALLSKSQWEALGEKRTVLTKYTYGD
jgi:tetratricopeptide (TPR) repeat protein